MDEKLIYLASPFGFSEAGREFMYSKMIPSIESAGYAVLDPWKLTSEEEIAKVAELPYGAEKREKWKRLNRQIGENNKEAIDRSSGLVAVLDGVDVDSGTSSEIGYAAALKKPILGYRGDFRISSDNEGSIVNLQVEYFIYLNGGKIINDVSCISKEAKLIFG